MRITKEERETIRAVAQDVLDFETWLPMNRMIFEVYNICKIDSKKIKKVLYDE